MVSKSLGAERAQLELYHISVFPLYLFLGLFLCTASDNGLSIETATNFVCFFSAFSNFSIKQAYFKSRCSGDNGGGGMLWGCSSQI